MLTVWCVWWRDPAAPDKYDEYCVQRLQRTVRENLSIPHRFICITSEQVEGVTCFAPLVDWPGWWQKIQLFRPGVALPINLYLDLDVVITGDLTPIVEGLGPHSIMAPNNWAASGHGGVQSSVMVWRPCQMTHWIYRDFPPEIAHWPPVNKPGVLWGDQEYITWLRGAGVIHVQPMPEQYVKSYKYHCRDGLPEDCRVVVFHGEPKPQSVKASWYQW